MTAVAVETQPTITRACAIEGCGRPWKKREWCGPHYERWRIHGHPEAGGPFRPSDPFDFIDVGHPLGCWLWTGSRTDYGYGRLGTAYAHRLIFELLRGPIPAGLSLDHLCRNPPCCNPDHLEPVTHRENVIRGSTPGARVRRSRTCSHGHPWTAENTYIRPDTGGFQCRACRRRRAGR